MPGKRLLTRDEFEAYVRNLERRLASIGISSVVTDESVTVSTFLELSDTPASYIPGLVWANAAENALVISGNKNPDVVPTSPDALDDEFEGGGALDGKWTITNDPGFDQTTHEGFLYGVLAKNASDNFATNPRMTQTAPDGEQTLGFIARVSVSCIAYGGYDGEFSGLGIGLFEATGKDGIMAYMGCRVSPSLTDMRVGAWGLSINNDTRAEFSTRDNSGMTHAGFVYVKFLKTTAAAYTSANTYEAYSSHNGLIWQFIGSTSYTFTNLADEVGFFFRFPKEQTGSPVVHVLVDYFRRID